MFRGRVQGVGFRATTRGIARGFAVTGWVRNEADGSVRLEVQGDRGEIEAFLAELRRALSRNIEESHVHSPLPDVAGEQGFVIK